MIKIIHNTFDFNERPIRRLYKPHIGHIKVASQNAAIKQFVSALKPDPNKSYFHVLFLGAGEYYSSNRNGDFFPEAGLIKRHKTFEEYGYVYRHHINKDPKKKYGDIEFVIYCPIMHRVEGIISLDNDKNVDILRKFDANDDIPVSMAAKLKFDMCSKCLNRARSLSEYCDHLKFEMNRVYPDGSKVYAINDDPIFFDLSLVWRPADQTAYFFDKVASISPSLNNLSVSLGELYYGRDNSMEKIAFKKPNEKRAAISKMALLEKHIEGVLSGKVEDGSIKPLLAVSTNEDFPHSILCQLKKYPLDSVLGSLLDHKIMVSPKDFFNLTGSEDNLFKDFMKALPGIFSKLRDSEDLDLLNFDFNLAAPRIPLYNIIRKHMKHKCLDDDFFSNNAKVLRVRKRPKTVIRIGDDGVSISKSYGGAIIKSSACKADALAKIYGLYKLAFCEKVNNKSSILYSLLSNYNTEV
jgi:hypothetical protein